jgi:hypothetical protein
MAESKDGHFDRLHVAFAISILVFFTAMLNLFFSFLPFCTLPLTSTRPLSDACSSGNPFFLAPRCSGSREPVSGEVHKHARDVLGRISARLFDLDKDVDRAMRYGRRCRPSGFVRLRRQSPNFAETDHEVCLQLPSLGSCVLPTGVVGLVLPALRASLMCMEPRRSRPSLPSPTRRMSMVLARSHCWPQIPLLVGSPKSKASLFRPASPSLS